jgi:hypothetical protein
MCCCDKPTVNGELGYKWNQPNAAPGRYPVNPPPLEEGDTLLFDEPGRCGGLDSHCHHFRVVKHSSSLYLLVRHGGGDERMRLYCHKGLADMLGSMDSTTRYWILASIHSADHDARREARETESYSWRKAAAEGRIKTRKLPARGVVRVTVEPELFTEAAA